jgi:hypothetical protein
MVEVLIGEMFGSNRKITREPWSSMQRVKKTNETTLGSEWRGALKKDLTGPALLEMSGYPCLSGASQVR